MRKAIALVAVLAVLATSAWAERVPDVTNYQGVLTDNSGSPVTGSFDMVFRIFDDSIGGTMLWQEIKPAVQVDQGTFDTEIAGMSLQSLSPTTSGINFADPITLYLEVEVEGEVISPRERLSSTPFSVASHTMSGDIYTSPGRLYMVPNGPPVSDCTYVPLELSVGTDITRMRMRPPVWALDCTYVPLEFSVNANTTHMHLHPPDPVTPLDSIEPAIVFNVDPTSALFEVWGIEPQPFRSNRADHGDPAFSLLADELTTSMMLHHPARDAGGATQSAYFRVKSEPATGASLLMFNPQPEPPADPALLLSMNGGPTTGVSMLMFNPQPEPPGGPDDHTMSISGGLGDQGPGIFMFNPQPEPPGTPPFLLGMQTSPIGAQFDMSSEPGFAKAAGGPLVTMSMSTDTAGGSMALSATKDIVGGSNELSEVLINSAPGGEAGIIIVNNRPGERIMNAEFGAGLSGGEEAGIIIVNNKPSDGSSSSTQMGTNLGGTEEAGIIIVNNRPGGAAPSNASTNMIVDANVGSSLQMDFNASSGIAPCVKVGVDETSGSVLQMDYVNAASGISPCIRVFSEAAGAGMSVFGSHPPEPGKSGPRTADSSVINLFADTGQATIELYGGAFDAPPSIVLISNDSGGRVGINTDAPQVELDVVGKICATGTIGACSDARYKKDVNTIKDALAIITQLRGVDYHWRTEEFPDKLFSNSEQIGFIAQELENVLPEVVSKNGDGFYSVDYGRLTPVLVEAVKEQQKTIDDVKTQNIELAKELSELKKMVQTLAAAQSATNSKELAATDLK